MESKFLAIALAFLWAGLVGLVEVRCRSRWYLPFFKSGLPAFRQSRRVSELSATIDTEKIESLMPTGKYPKLLFRKVDDRFFVFKDDYSRYLPDDKLLAPKDVTPIWYAPVMHGNLVINRARTRIEVIGRMDWAPLLFTLVLPVILVIWSQMSFFSALAMFIVLVPLIQMPLVLSYLAQKRRLAEVTDIVVKHASDLS